MHTRSALWSEGWDVKGLRWHSRVMAKQVGPGLAKPEYPFGLTARDENEARVSGFHTGPQQNTSCNKAGYKAAAVPVMSGHSKSFAKRAASI